MINELNTAPQDTDILVKLDNGRFVVGHFYLSLKDLQPINVTTEFNSYCVGFEDKIVGWLPLPDEC